MGTQKRPQTGREAIRWAASFLKECGIAKENSLEESRMLFGLVSNKTRVQLLTTLDMELRQNIWEEYVKLIRRRGNNEPLQYITGQQEFMSLPFYVNSAVLVPRWDTEILVEEGISLLNDKAKPLILDLGTGSGAIAVSLAYYLPEARIHAVDISNDALEIARINAKENGVDTRIRFYEGDMFTVLKEKKAYDLIVSNPPYISEDEMQELPPDVKQEPRQALAGGADGLDYYWCIAENAGQYLADNGRLLVEIGYTQGVKVQELLEKNSWQNVRIIKDLGGRDRVVSAWKD